MATKIVIAGASGYIGQALIPALLEKFPEASIIAFSRADQTSADPRVSWKACDLFSMKSLESAIPNDVDLAYYLVHSMGPTAHLDQGSFADYDLILADNFARVLGSTRVRHVIYLGGLIPQNETLSLHLQSRLEVEDTFEQARLPITVFRAGLIIGEAGSSFQILTKLVRRLPVMICPKWTQTRTTPVDLITVIRALTDSALDDRHLQKIYDLAGCEALTYIEMMRATAHKMQKKRLFMSVPFFTPTLSRLWVSVITGTSKALVYPLVESLEHPMVARPDHLYGSPVTHRTYASLLDSIQGSPPAGRRKNPRRYRAQRKTVRSVQRLPLPPGRDALWVKNEYMRWLPRFLRPWIQVEVENDCIRFAFFGQKANVLELSTNAARSNPDRQLLYITGGLLAAHDNSGRLEFRVVLRRRFILAAIHDFKPSLPWFIYQKTQAVVHLLVMKRFGRHLSQKG